jgi:heptosyltransferase-2
MKRILFIKLGAIGDVIQAAAAVDELSFRNPGIQVDWVVGQSIAELLKQIAVADKVISVPDQALFGSSIFQRVKALLVCWTRIARNSQRYDAVYIAHTNWQYDLLALPAYILNPHLIFQKKKRFSPGLKEYRVSEYLKFLTGQAIGATEGVNFLQKLGDKLLLKSQLQKLQHERNGQKQSVVLVPGGSKNALRDDFLRRWPIDRYVELARLLINQGYQVLLVGANSDQWAKPYFKELQIIDLIGKTSLLELVEVLNQSDLIITHDTGPLHLATLTKTSLITLFGPTPAAAVAPIGRERLRVFTSSPDVACAPCYDGKNYANCNGPICLKSISVDDVFAASQHFLKVKGLH